MPRHPAIVDRDTRDSTNSLRSGRLLPEGHPRALQVVNHPRPEPGNPLDIRPGPKRAMLGEEAGTLPIVRKIFRSLVMQAADN